MSDELFKLLLVAAGGVLGICGALLTAVTSAYFTERRYRQERQHRLLELTGRLQALQIEMVGMDTAGLGRRFMDEILRKKESIESQSTEELSVSIGLMERHVERVEAIRAETDRAIWETQKLEIEKKSLEERLVELQLKVADLQSKRGPSPTPMAGIGQVSGAIDPV